jgi:hypothetical protein
MGKYHDDNVKEIKFLNLLETQTHSQATFGRVVVQIQAVFCK